MVRNLTRVLILIASFVCFTAQSVYAQNEYNLQSAAYGLGVNQAELIRQIRLTISAVRAYRCTHGHLPQQTDEMDDALKSIFKNVALTAPDPRIYIQSRNNFRVFYQFEIALDPSIRAIPVINGRVQVPNNWDAPPNTITILIDGSDTFAVWAAAPDRKPITDPTTHNPLVVIQTVDCTQSQVLQ